MRPHNRAPHPPETVARALELRAKGLTLSEIARAVGASRTSVSIWCAPDPERERRKEEDRKRKYDTPCVDCGKMIRQGSTRCIECHNMWLEKNKRWTKERVIEAIQEWDRIHGRPPTANDWNGTIARKNGRPRGRQYPSANAVYGRNGVFPLWADAIEAAGFPRPRWLARGTKGKRYWTEERIIAALRAHADDGHAPLMVDWNRAASDRPTSQWVVRVFGNWGNAVAAAGLEQHPRSGGGRRRVSTVKRPQAPPLSEERLAFVRKYMDDNVLKQYIVRLMWRKWGYSSEVALKHALTKKGVLQEPGWQYRFNRQLTQEEIEEGLSL